MGGGRGGRVIEITEARRKKRKIEDDFVRVLASSVRDGVVTASPRLTRLFEKENTTPEDMLRVAAGPSKVKVLNVRVDGGWRGTVVWTTIERSVVRMEAHIYDDLQVRLWLAAEAENEK